jgi:molybdopterin-guanine dinucleotide biosynthesis protein A
VCVVFFNFSLLKTITAFIRITERKTSTVTQDLSWETLVGEKTQQSFFNIDSSTSTMSLSREISPKQKIHQKP